MAMFRHGSVCFSNTALVCGCGVLWKKKKKQRKTILAIAALVSN